MKKKLIIAIMAAVLVLGGCDGGANAPAGDDVLAGESISIEQKEESGQNAAEKGSEKESAGSHDADSQKEESTTESGQATKDYAEQIKAEIDVCVQLSDTLSKEFDGVEKLYDEYSELCGNAADQATINELSKWVVQVWKEETLSLLNRIKEMDAKAYGEISMEYENWESHVPFMAEKMSEAYRDGSIYPQMYSYNKAERYRRKAYSLASILAEFTKENDFVFRDSTRCGFYGYYTGESYLTITNGMELGSYNIVIHIDDEKELRGWGTVEDAPDCDTYLLFESDDGSVKGFVSHSALEASFYVTETDYSVIGPEGAYTFHFKY